MSAFGPHRPGRRRLTAGMGDIAGGLSGGISSIPGNIAVGFVALSPLGVDAQGSGVGMALLGAAVGGGLFTLVCRTRGLAAGGSMSFALIVAGVLTTLLRQGVLQSGLPGFPAALAIIAMLTVLTGLCEAGLAASGLGHLVTMLPYPVVSGIRNGVALLMILFQLRPMLGIAWEGGVLHWPHPAALAVSVVTLVLMLRPVRALRPVPTALVAILAGTSVHHLIAAILGPQGSADLLGPLLEVPPGGAQHLHALRAGLAALPGLPFWTLVPTLAPAALTIAVVSTLETLVGASVMQDIGREYASSRADLFALAVANVGGGLCGTLPVTGGSAGSMAMWSAGGRSKAAGGVRTAVLGAVVLLAGTAIGLLPAAALAGLVVSNGLQGLDRELLRLARAVTLPAAQDRAELAGNLLVGVAVTCMAMAVSLVAAVLTGLLLAAALFVATMSGGAVRRRYRNPGNRSRTVRREAETEALLRHGHEIEVIELHGALFFGSADQLVRAVDAACMGGARCIVLDFRRVSQIDLSGGRRLLQVAAIQRARGVFLAFAGLNVPSPAWAGDRHEPQARLPADRSFPTLEEALAAAELVLLAAHGVSRVGGQATASEVLGRIGIPDVDAAALLAHTTAQAVPAGTTIVTAGEQAGTVFILVEGEVTVSLPPDLAGVGTRLATLTPGTLFGEMALLSGAPRSANITAATPVRCLALGVPAIAELRRTRPDLAYHVMAAIARQLARNVEMANIALRSAGE